MTQTRTPRQRVGEDLVPVTILIVRATRIALLALATAEQRSVSQVGRQAIEAYVQARARGRDAPGARVTSPRGVC